MANTDTDASILDNMRRQATVEDMVDWLWDDGHYKGLGGFSNEWTPEEFMGTDSNDAEPEAFSATLLPTHPAERDDEWIDGMESGLRDAAWEASHEKHVKDMIRQHKRLIPGAIKLIDKRLLDAGVSIEEIQALTTGAATDAYKKLDKLDEVQRPPRVKRVQFRVICELLTEGLSTVDLWLPKNCLLGDFERSMEMHASARGFREQLGMEVSDVAGISGAGDGMETKDQTPTSQMETTVEDRVWVYKLANRESGEAHPISKDGWKALKSQDDFTEMMKVLVKDDSLFAAVCLESTIQKCENMKQNKKKKPQEGETSRGKTPEYSDDEALVEIDWDAIGCQPIPDDFDWSRVENFRILPEGEVREGQSS